jgi:hypothetical protein
MSSCHLPDVEPSIVNRIQITPVFQLLPCQGTDAVSANFDACPEPIELAARHDSDEDSDGFSVS